MEQQRHMETVIARSNAPRLAFGYDRGLPREAQAGWGARLVITQSGVVDILRDKQGAFGLHQEREALTKHLNSGPLDAALAMASTLLKDGSLFTDDFKEVVLYEDARIRILGNPMGSCGHLHICAYFSGGS